MNKEITELYGNRVRVRVSGICWRDTRLLMVNHSLGNGDFWAPPGGGIETGQTAQGALIREFEEETGIIVEPGPFQFACEFIEPPLHAIELFFNVSYQSGQIKTGSDPEMGVQKQIIQEVKWMTFSELKELRSENLHGIFKLCKEPQELMNLTGYWKI